MFLNNMLQNKVLQNSLHFMAFLLLLVMGLVQFNDPDPLFWIGLYFICALIPLVKIFGVYFQMFYILCLLYCFVAFYLCFEGALQYLQHANEEALMQKMNDDKPYIEEAREFIGALISVVVISIYQVIHWRAKRTPEDIV